MLKLGKLLVIFVLVISLLLFTSILVKADTSADVTISATGILVGSPGAFTVYYISDFEVGMSWIKPVGGNNTMIRVKYGSTPVDRNDGYLVYYGNLEVANDPNIDLTSGQLPTYRAWSQRVDGVWENMGATGEANFMSQSFMFIGLIIMAGFLTFLARYTGQLLMRIAAALIWLVLGIWLLVGNITNLGIASPWTQVLAFVFIIMVLVPLTWQMGTETRVEVGTKSWTEWGKRPLGIQESRSTRVRRERREKIRERLHR